MRHSRCWIQGLVYKQTIHITAMVHGQSLWMPDINTIEMFRKPPQCQIDF